MLARQVRRMMADPRSDALVKNFAGQWLFLRNVPLTGPAQSEFPDFDDSLRQAFRRETELFFESIVREDRNALDLLRADYTFLNERLAAPLRDPERQGQPVQTRHVGEGQRARRAAGPRQHSDGDLLSRPHLAGGARQMDPREPAGHAAAAAAAGRRRSQTDQRQRRGPVDARAPGAASRQPGLRGLSFDDGSAGPRARELRRRREMADARRVVPADRRVRGAARRHHVRGSRRPQGGAAGAIGPLPGDPDREAADLRPRAAARALRHAGRARDRARRRPRTTTASRRR